MVLEKKVKFVFDYTYLKTFGCIKEKLISTPVIVSPDWSLPFEFMYDAISVVLGAVQGQKAKVYRTSIHYASKVIDYT